MIGSFCQVGFGTKIVAILFLWTAVFERGSLRTTATFLSFDDTVKTYVQNATFGAVYSNFTVNATSQIMFMYSYTMGNKTTAVRVSMSSSNATEKFPVMFVARQQETILSWQIPLDIIESYSYYSVNRTLCPIDKTRRKDIDEHQLIYITVSSMSPASVGFNLTATVLNDFELSHETPRTFNVTAPRPVYYMYTFPTDVSSVLLKVSSASHTCMTVSVQTIKCPVFDLETNVEFSGRHQTMSTQAAMFLEKSDFETLGGFYVVFIVKPDNRDCERYVEPSVIVPPHLVSETVKTITVEIKGTLPSSQYYKAIFAAIGVLLLFYLISFIIGIVFAGCGLHKGLDDLTEEERASLRVHINPHFPRAQLASQSRNSERAKLLSQPQGGENNLLNPSPRSGNYGTMAQVSRGRELHDVMASQTDSSDSSSLSLDLDEDSIDFLNDAEEEKEVVRTKTALYVSDLARKKPKKLIKIYKLYHWNLLTIAIFYGLPVIQLVITYQRVLNASGNQDLCYYNFNCAHPLRPFLSSFNNVFSNIGYVMLGILFILIVYRRDVLHKQVVQRHGELEKQYGIPQHFGLFYAMGLALIMEGIMSACYHVCPNYTNFQFDTSFMYIIACLCMLKIYQSRHPDINAKAHVSYFTMALIIFFAVLGVVYGASFLWIIYALIHMLMTLIVTAQVYYMGRWSVDRYIFKRVFLVLISDCKRCSRPAYPNRFILLLVGNCINWAFALYGAISQPSDFASYLLAIFIGNLLLYCIFYIIMKRLSHERLSWLVIIVILTSALTWAGSLYFFFQHLTSWQKTPAGSRAGNQECILLEFYDHHDVWHFLSAISLFFSFMILLLLDDDLSQVRRDQIPVF
ncbi:unnamed protein product [Candidula unifasciata]|uniref:SID1 transmembrane family member 1 n=1 Tax=Candidula unifasciata TaxID=100452 RepID=A0A8S3Z0U2_9EUPU|nr:unnamed protein product [Candidula unifasciata]